MGKENEMVHVQRIWFTMTKYGILWKGALLTDISFRLYFWKVCVTSPLCTMDSDIIIQVPEFILFMECCVFMEIISAGL